MILLLLALLAADPQTDEDTNPNQCECVEWRKEGDRLVCVKVKSCPVPRRVPPEKK